MRIDDGPSEGSDSYFLHCRRDVLAMVPSWVRSVLSVGCASGVTEAELSNRGIAVVGVELNSRAVATARSRGLTVLEGDAHTVDVKALGHCFDCIIYADILEHLSDPLAVLRNHLSVLRPGGTIIVSVPNFRHYSVLYQLFAAGRITYTEAGILDATHIRITTRKMVQGWFAQCGVRTVKYRYHMSGRRDRLLSACFAGICDEFFATQVLLLGKTSKHI